MKLRSALLCGIFTAALSSTSFADTLFNFNFSGVDFSGSGQIAAANTSTAGEYRITGVTGTTNGKAISGVEPVGGTFGNDNLLFYNSAASPTYFDLDGVTYALSTGAQVNLFYKSGYNEYLLRAGGDSFLLDHASISVAPVSSPVPEPGSLALLGTGALGLLGMARGRVRMLAGR